MADTLCGFPYQISDDVKVPEGEPPKFGMPKKFYRVRLKMTEAGTVRLCVDCDLDAEPYSVWCEEHRKTAFMPHPE